MPNLIGYMAVRNVVVPLSATTQALGKADALAEMIDTCTVFRAQGSPRALAPQFINEPCKVEDLNVGNDPGMDEINRSLNAKKLTVRATTVLLVSDQVQHAGHTYEIFAISTDRTPQIENSAMMRLVTI